MVRVLTLLVLLVACSNAAGKKKQGGGGGKGPPPPPPGARPHGAPAKPGAARPTPTPSKGKGGGKGPGGPPPPAPGARPGGAPPSPSGGKWPPPPCRDGSWPPCFDMPSKRDVERMRHCDAQWAATLLSCRVEANRERIAAGQPQCPTLTASARKTSSGCVCRDQWSVRGVAVCGCAATPYLLGMPYCIVEKSSCPQSQAAITTPLPDGSGALGAWDTCNTTSHWKPKAQRPAGMDPRAFSTMPDFNAMCRQPRCAKRLGVFGQKCKWTMERKAPFPGSHRGGYHHFHAMVRHFGRPHGPHGPPRPLDMGQVMRALRAHSDTCKVTVWNHRRGGEVEVPPQGGGDVMVKVKVSLPPTSPFLNSSRSVLIDLISDLTGVPKKYVTATTRTSAKSGRSHLEVGLRFTDRSKHSTAGQKARADLRPLGTTSIVSISRADASGTAFNPSAREGAGLKSAANERWGAQRLGVAALLAAATMLGMIGGVRAYKRSADGAIVGAAAGSASEGIELVSMDASDGGGGGGGARVLPVLAAAPLGPSTMDFSLQLHMNVSGAGAGATSGAGAGATSAAPSIPEHTAVVSAVPMMGAADGFAKRQRRQPSSERTPSPSLGSDVCSTGGISPEHFPSSSDASSSGTASPKREAERFGDASSGLGSSSDGSDGSDSGGVLPPSPSPIMSVQARAIGASSGFADSSASSTAPGAGAGGGAGFNMQQSFVGMLAMEGIAPPADSSAYPFEGEFGENCALGDGSGYRFDDLGALPGSGMGCFDLKHELSAYIGSGGGGGGDGTPGVPWGAAAGGSGSGGGNQFDTPFTHEPEGEYDCPMEGCNYTAKQRRYLAAHIRTHAGTKPYTCSSPGCDYTSAYRGHLLRHERVHSGEKPFPCTWEGCNYRARQSAHLTAHIRKHTNERPWICEEAGCVYQAPSRWHLKRHHKGRHEGGLRSVLSSAAAVMPAQRPPPPPGGAPASLSADELVMGVPVGEPFQATM